MFGIISLGMMVVYIHVMQFISDVMWAIPQRLCRFLLLYIIMCILFMPLPNSVLLSFPVFAENRYIFKNSLCLRQKFADMAKMS